MRTQYRTLALQMERKQNYETMLTLFGGGKSNVCVSPMYREDQWELLLKSIEDKGYYQERYKDWRKMVDKSNRRHEKTFNLKLVDVDVKKMNAWLKKNNFPNTSMYRSRYFAFLQGSPLSSSWRRSIVRCYKVHFLRCILRANKFIKVSTRAKCIHLAKHKVLKKM